MSLSTQRGTGLSPKAVDFEETWKGLSKGVKSVISLTGVTRGMAIYEDVYALCTANPRPHTEQLYLRLRTFLEQHADSIVQHLCEVGNSGELILLSEYAKYWKTFSIGSEYLHSMFRYLNQHWVRRVVEESKQRLGCLYQGPSGFFPGTSGSPSQKQQASSSSSASSSLMNEVCEVGALCMVIWRDRVYFKVRNALVSACLKSIEMERIGEASADLTGVITLISSALRLGSLLHKKLPLELYQRDLEDPILRETEVFYIRESENILTNQGGTCSYLEKAEGRLEEELARGKKFLDQSSLQGLRIACCKALADRHSAIIVSDCLPQLENGNIVFLNRAYRVLKLCTSGIEKGTAPLKEIVEEWMTKKGSSQLLAIPQEEKEDPQKFVETLLSIHTYLSDIVLHAFENDHQFVAAMDSACRKIINNKSNSSNSDSLLSSSSSSTTPSRSPEFLARYCDILLRRGLISSANSVAAVVTTTTTAAASTINPSANSTNTSLTKSEEGKVLEEQLAKVVSIFNYIEDKDIFQKFYSRLLARRLITGASTSEDAETSVIAGIKQVCGFEYVNRLSRMFNDMSISAELSSAFIEKMSSSIKFDFTVNVLTSGFWPMMSSNSNTNASSNSSSMNLKLPIEIEQCISEFTNFYASKHQGRKLQWNHQLGRGELRCCNNVMKRPYELQLNVSQMLILLLFNNSSTYSDNKNEENIHVSEIEMKSGLNGQELTRTIKSLVDGKLLVSPNNDDRFSINPNFTSRRIKVKIAAGGMVSKGEQQAAHNKGKTEEDGVNEYKGVEEDRKMYLQAAIVRVMKSRKELRHVQLVQEVIAQAKARFNPSVTLIKRCIEQLIEKEFLCRVEGQSDRYAYIA